MSAARETRDERLLGPGYRVVTIGMVALVSLAAFESLAVATVMPAVAQKLDGVSLYPLAFGSALAASVVGMIVAAGWNDRRGPTAPLWHGIAWFVSGLIIAGLAPNMTVLLIGRLLQGFGDGLLWVSLYVVVGRIFPATLRPRVFATFSAAWVVPSMVGPSISALILEYLGWRWVFLGVPLLALPAAWMLRPGLRALTAPPAPITPALNEKRRIVWAIGAAICACLLPSVGPQSSVSAPLLTLLTAASLAVFAHKLLPRGTLTAQPGVPAVVALRGLAAAAFFSAEVFVPLMLARERGLSALAVGAVLTTGALCYSGGSWYQGAVSNSAAPRTRLRGGLALIGIGVSLVATTLWPSVPLVIGMVGWAIAGFGMGVVYPILAVLILEFSAPHEQGSNSSALQLANALAIAATLALGGSVFAYLLPHSSLWAFLTTFVVSALLAFLGSVLAMRCFVRKAEWTSQA